MIFGQDLAKESSLHTWLRSLVQRPHRSPEHRQPGKYVQGDATQVCCRQVLSVMIGNITSTSKCSSNPIVTCSWASAGCIQVELMMSNSGFQYFLLWTLTRGFSYSSITSSSSYFTHECLAFAMAAFWHRVGALNLLISCRSTTGKVVECFCIRHPEAGQLPVGCWKTDISGL